MSVTRLPLRRYFSVPRLKRRRAEFALLIALAVVLELAAGIGLASVAGFSPVRAALGGFDWVWLACTSRELGCWC
jgi:hypothetical protein